MASWLGRIGLAALWIIPALGAGMAMAATSPQMDILTDEAVRSSADTIDVDTVRPIAKPAQPAASRSCAAIRCGRCRCRRADREQGTPDLFGRAPAAAACGRGVAGGTGLCAAAPEGGRRSAAARPGRSRGGRGRRHCDPHGPHAPGRNAGRGNVEARRAQRGAGAAAAGSAGGAARAGGAAAIPPGTGGKLTTPARATPLLLPRAPLDAERRRVGWSLSSSKPRRLTK